MNKVFIILSIVISISLIILVLTNLKSKPNTDVKAGTDTSVIIEDDTQIINVISNSYGYSPRKISAQAGKKTLLRIDSKNSYGCERSFRIPQMNVNQILPPQGITEIDLGTPETGENVFGTCSMGMYTFTIIFK